MRTRVALVVAVPASLIALTGCPLGHQSGAARAQEAANELNVNTRFGRMELAAERVAPKAREAFFERRRTWGHRIRLADYEMAGMKMKGEEDAEMYVRIAWYRVDEGDLHVTTLRQKWHDFKGDWRLVEEARSDGDVGLVGEPIVAVPPPAGPRNVQFPTIRLGGEPAMPAEELPEH
jgi:hypothetical protein